jgi:hypothetical protein
VLLVLDVTPRVEYPFKVAVVEIRIGNRFNKELRQEFVTDEYKTIEILSSSSQSRKHDNGPKGTTCTSNGVPTAIIIIIIIPVCSHAIPSRVHGGWDDGNEE